MIGIKKLCLFSLLAMLFFSACGNASAGDGQGGKSSDAIIIVGTPNWCQYVKDAAADPITGYDNIMYALHFYAATHTDWLRNDMVTALNAGLPIFVSEYGICDASGNGAIDEYQANAWIEAMNQYGVSYCGWTYEDLSQSGKWQYDMLRKYQLGN